MAFHFVRATASTHALLDACTYDRHTALRALLADACVDPTELESASLRFAGQYCSVGAVRLLLADGRADPTARHAVALRTSAANGYADVVQLFLDDGRADPRALDSQALRCAAIDGHEAIVRALLADGRADPMVVPLESLRNPEMLTPYVRRPGTLPLVTAEVRWRRRRQLLRAGLGPVSRA
jgi:hypothetical protein